MNLHAFRLKCGWNYNPFIFTLEIPANTIWNIKTVYTWPVNVHTILLVEIYDCSRIESIAANASKETINLFGNLLHAPLVGAQLSNRVRRSCFEYCIQPISTQLAGRAHPPPGATALRTRPTSRRARAGCPSFKKKKNHLFIHFKFYECYFGST